MPRRRARGRSPHRDGIPFSRNAGNDAQAGPNSKGSSEQAGRDQALLEGSQDAVRIAAEVVDIALVAAAVAMRELVVRLDGRRGTSGAESSDHQ